MSEFHEPQLDAADAGEAETPQIQSDIEPIERPSDVDADLPSLPPLGTGRMPAAEERDRTTDRRPRQPPSRADLDPNWRQRLRPAPSSSDAPPLRSNPSWGGRPQPTSRADADPNWRQRLKPAPSSSDAPPLRSNPSRGGRPQPTSRADADPNWRQRDKGVERPAFPSSSSSRGRGQSKGLGGRGDAGRGNPDRELRRWLTKQGDTASFVTDEAWPTTVEVLHWAQGRLNAPSVTHLKVAASSGACLTFLYSGADVVVQHFTRAGMKPPQLAYRAIEKMREEQDPRLKNLAEIIELDTERQLIVVEKIESLNQRFDLLKEGNGRASPRDFLANTDEMERLVTDIATAATALSEILDLRQNDERLDNVGIKNGNYALFDYGMTSMTQVGHQQNVAGATGEIKKSIGSLRQRHGVRQ